MLITSDKKPSLVETFILYATRRYNININVKALGENYEFEQIEVPVGRFDYAGIVDALVIYKYPNDKMQAVINNYLLEPENEEYITAFNEMQAWRKEAKEIAKQALEYELH